MGLGVLSRARCISPRLGVAQVTTRLHQAGWTGTLVKTTMPRCDCSMRLDVRQTIPTRSVRCLTQITADRRGGKAESSRRTHLVHPQRIKFCSLAATALIAELSSSNI